MNNINKWVSRGFNKKSIFFTLAISIYFKAMVPLIQISFVDGQSENNNNQEASYQTKSFTLSEAECKKDAGVFQISSSKNKIK